MKPLETTLGDWLSDAQVLRARGHEKDATLIESFAAEVRATGGCAIVLALLPVLVGVLGLLPWL